MSEKAPRPIYILIGVYILIYYWIIIFGNSEDYIVSFSRNLLSATGPLLASIWLLNRHFKDRHTKDYFWLFLGIGTLNYFLAEIVWLYYENYLLVEVPFPGIPDLFYMLQIIFYLVALFYYFISIENKYGLWRWIFEVLIIMTIASAFSYQYLIKGMVENPSFSGFYLFVSIGYPVGDLILLFSALVLFYSSLEIEKRRVIFVIVIGLIFQVIADTGYIYLTIQEQYETGSLFDPLFTLSLLIVGHSSFYRNHNMNKREFLDIHLSVVTSKTILWRNIGLYGLITVLLFFYYVNMSKSLNMISMAIGVTVFLILIRQVVILLENSSLLDKYQAKNDELLLSTQRYHSLFKYHPDAVFSLDFNGIFQNANESCFKMTGMNSSDIVGKSIYQFIEKNDCLLFKKNMTHIYNGPQRLEVKFINGKNLSYIKLTLIPIIINGELEGVFCVGKDITEVKKNEEKISYLAFHDVLTGLPNRAAFERELQYTIDYQFPSTFLGVMYIDLDRFKVINDTLGHDAGDELLIDVAKRLDNCMNGSGYLSRLGGDEFTIIIPNIKSMDIIESFAEKILEELNKPYNVRGHIFLATASIGVSIKLFEMKETVSSLMKKADLAMYKAKNEGKNQFKVYHPSMDENLKKSFMLASELSKAIYNGELVLYYQPLVNTVTNQIYGMEALVRWQHPSLGLLSPDEFIPLAEDTDIIITMGEWVLREACRQVKLFSDHLMISVNISPKQFLSIPFVQVIEQVLMDSKLNPYRLHLEITEAVTMNNWEDNHLKLTRLRELGVNISIDDFGTGYSSLSYLAKLPISSLKIPREFVHGIGEKDSNNAILQTIITLGNQLNLNVIAEGIETFEQKEMLEAMGCHLMQGYYFSKPIPSIELEKLLKSS